QQSVGRLKGQQVKPRLEVQTRFDFLSLSAAEEQENTGDSGHPKTRGSDLGEGTFPSGAGGQAGIRKVPACIPQNYIPDERHRIEVYRKLAQITDAAGARALRRELRDRFGPLPAPLSLLLEVAALKVLAGERGITAIETRGDRLMLTRGNDY